MSDTTKSLSINNTATSLAYSVLIVENEPLVRLGLQELIATDPAFHVCGEASTVSEAARLLRVKSPDLILLDISLDDEEQGTQLLTDYAFLTREVRTIILSGRDPTTYLYQLQHDQVAGVVTKSETPELLLEAMHDVIQGGTFYSPRMVASVIK